MARSRSAIYEQDFRPCAYGFRPGRNPHEALTALKDALFRGKMNWVVDADISAFFCSVLGEHFQYYAELPRPGELPAAAHARLAEVVEASEQAWAHGLGALCGCPVPVSAARDVGAAAGVPSCRS